MKFKSPFRVLASIVTIGFAASFAQAYVVYEDNFNGTGGTTLNGRAPNLVNTGSATYTGVGLANSTVLNGGGLAVTISSGSIGASIALPELITNQVITLTMDMRVAATAGSQYMAIGFTNVANTLSNNDAREIMASIRADGLGRVGTNAATNNLYTDNTRIAGGTGNITTLTRMVMTLDAGTKTLSVTTSSDLGNFTLYNGSIASFFPTWESLKFVTFQFAGGAINNSSSSQPAFFDYFKVEIQPVVIPEAESVAILIAGMLGMVIFVRKIRKKANMEA